MISGDVSLSCGSIESNINICFGYICLLLQNYHFAFTLVNGEGHLLAHKLIYKSLSEFHCKNFEGYIQKSFRVIEISWVPFSRQLENKRLDSC